MLLSAASASADVDDRARLSAWAEARAAATLGAPRRAAQGYAAALALSPDNEALAARALSEGMSAGDADLALRAARILEAKGKLAPDARLLLLTDALRKRDWKRANLYIDQLQSDEIFAFMAPTMRAWVAQDSGKGDPIAILDAARGDQLAAGYAAEHRPMLLLADGKVKQGIEALTPVLEAGERATRLRIAAAATIARRDRKAALTLLEGDREPLIVARKLVEARKPLPGAIDTAAAGVSNFLLRVALDLQAQDVNELALTYARLATFLTPQTSEAWFVASAMLTAQARYDEAIALLANIPPHDPFYPGVADRRIRLLAAADKTDAALSEARALAEAPAGTAADWARLGDLYSDEERHEDAAAAYAAATERAKTSPAGQPEWTLWLLKGGALEQAGRWPEAKAALIKANELEPNQPLVLNYLGYAQLERRENVVEAMKLVEQASALQPDSPEITDSLGWAHFLHGNVNKAIPLLEKAAEARPGDVEINEHLGDAYYSAGRRFEARYAWEAALLNAKGKHADRLRAKIGTGLTPELASP